MPRSKRETPLRKRIYKSLDKQVAAAGGRLFYFSISDAWATGYPDTHGTYDARAFYLELKAEDGHLSELQRIFLTRAARAGAYVGVIRAVLGAPGSLKAVITEYGSTVAIPLDGDRWLLDRMEKKL